MRRLIFGLIGTIGLVSCSGTQSSGGGGNGDLQWTAHGRTNEEQRYVPLDQVNADNIGQLGLAWYADIADKGGYQSTPLVVDGKLYLTGPWSKVFAFAAVTGEALW